MRGIVLLFSFTLLAGCGNSKIQDIIDGRQIDYQREDYQESVDLQYPPDIIIAEKERSGAQLLSEYRIQAVPSVEQPDEIELENARKVYYRREGNLRWIDLDISPDNAWNLAQQFWGELDFPLVREDPETGTMETDWLDLRQPHGSVGLASFLDDFLNRVRDSGERDKFVLRVEGTDENSSIFISHRHISAKFDREGLFSGYSPLPADSQLETEMLRRMMIFAADIPEESQPAAFAEEIEDAEEERDYELSQTVLHIKKPSAESWQLVRIGLDRGGFTIEDQDHVELAYYIRHSGGPESQKIFGQAETNIFNKLFGEEKPVFRDIKLTLSAENDNLTAVTVAAADDKGELTELQQSVLLELLSINLP